MAPITLSPPSDGNSQTGNFSQKKIAQVLPGEVVIKSSPIQTELHVVSSYSTAASEATTPTTTQQQQQQSLEDEKIDSTTSSSVENRFTYTDNRLSDQQQLIDFIQKLMGQAKKEQEKLKNKTPPPVELQLDIKKVDLSNFSPISINKFPQMDLEDFVSPVTEGQTKGGVTPRQSQTQTTTTTSTTSTTTTTSLATTTERARETAPVLPFRTTLRTTSTTTVRTTTEDGTPSGVITKLLSEAAAPIAGLSAATLAYSAAAMLPVWLPAALGRRRSISLTDLSLPEISPSQKDLSLSQPELSKTLLEILSRSDLNENTNFSALVSD